MRFFPREKGEVAFVEGFPLKRPFSLSRVGKNRISQGVENRGSTICVPLALREAGIMSRVGDVCREYAVCGCG